MKTIFILMMGFFLSQPLMAHHPQGKRKGSLKIGIFPHHVATGDFNHDGKVDLAIPASGSEYVTVLMGNGKGGFFSNHNFPVGIGPVWIEIADFDNDGKLDWVTSNTGSSNLTF